MMVSLDNLNKAQRDAVECTDGPVMILAGAGSGKTRTLVTRVSHLIEGVGISPYQILALTFSNKAAKEMRDRISTQVSNDIGALQITTFHAFCARVLRQEAQYLGLSKNFTIYDQAESRAVVKTILARHGISTKEISPYEVLYFMDDIKNNGLYPGRESDYAEIDRDHEFYQFYTEYESELHKANAVDFGGLITGTIQLFEKYPDVLKRYQDRFKYLLVDEYQDTNRAQFELVLMLAHERRNICVVGDEDQSIYSWRGADINNILDFEKMFPEVKVLKLEQNYRSSKTIIEAATHVIARNEMRKGKSMWTDNDQGEAIQIYESHNDKKESEYISQEIKKLIKAGSSHGDIAVFYRTNSQSRLIEDSLRAQNMPYRVVGGVKFYDRKEIKDLLSYLRLIVNPKDSLALSRVINVPARGIGATSLRKLENVAVENNQSLLEAVENIVENPESYSHLRLSAKIKSALREFITLVNDVKLLDQRGDVLPSSLYDKVLHESGYWQYLKAAKDYESMARLENLQELGSAVKQYETGAENATLTGFLETITLDSNTDDGEFSESGEVSLMTVHGAKGLEFNYVFVAGIEENVFPSYRSLEDGERGIEEERRLFYVAMTRAMKRLYLCFAQGRMLFGQLKFNGPSRFLYEIPEKYYSWKKDGNIGSQTFSGSSSFQKPSWEEDDDFNQETYYDDNEGDVVYQVNTKPKKEERVAKSSYPKGSTVVHSLYGEGQVLETEGFGTDEKVVIKFKDGARKKFMVKFAPLQIIG